MRLKESLRQYFDEAIRGPDSVPLIGARARELYPLTERLTRQRIQKAGLALSKEYRAKGHWRCFRRSLGIGVELLGAEFVRSAEVAGLFLPPAVPDRGFSAALRVAAKESLGRHPALNQRLKTHVAFDTLHRVVHRAGDRATKVLRLRPFRFGRTLLGLTSLHFLREHLQFTAGEQTAALLRAYRGPEYLAESASAALALANGYETLTEADFMTPLSGFEISDDLIAVLHFGQAISELRELGKSIAIFGYDLLKDSGHRYRVVPSSDVEYALRLGYVRAETGIGTSHLTLARRRGAHYVSMSAAAKDLLNRLPGMAVLAGADTPVKRLRFEIPLADPWLQALGDFDFYEDLVFEHQLGHELELPISRDLELVAGLTLGTFLKTWKVLRFLAVTELTALRAYQSEELVIHNSLVRIIPREALKELVKACGLSTEQAESFLSLTTADVHGLGFYDLQYTPFLQVETSHSAADGRSSHIVYSSALLATTNIAVNVQRAHGIRFKGNSDLIVKAAAEALRRTFANIRTNVELKRGEDRTDVDIMVMSQDKLYLIECKHSVTPTGPHETRDLWNDISRGVSQVKLAKEILRDSIEARLAGVFPKVKRSQFARLDIELCILCSHRVFSGLRLDGVPIRDLSSLLVMMGDATVGMGTQDDHGVITMRRYRLRKTEKTTPRDFDEYLGDDSLFFSMFRPFMRPYSRLQWLFDSKILVAENSFVFAVDLHAWRKNLENCGAVSVDDERVPIPDLSMRSASGDSKPEADSE